MTRTRVFLAGLDVVEVVSVGAGGVLGGELVIVFPGGTTFWKKKLKQPV